MKHLLKPILTLIMWLAGKLGLRGIILKAPKAMKMSNLRFKRVMRLDTIQRHFRLFRILWERGIVGDGNGYSAKLSFALEPRLFRWHRDARKDRLATLFGLRVHYWGII